MQRRGRYEHEESTGCVDVVLYMLILIATVVGAGIGIAVVLFR